MTNIVTLRLDDASQAHFEALRQRYFPPERNQIPAHLTLFHTLPDTPEIKEVLKREASAQRSFSLSVTGLRALGKGVAYKLSSDTLSSLHARLATEFADSLTAQDRQRLQPHVVVQNKMSPAAARELMQLLEATFIPIEVQAIALDLWNYLGGPWQLASTYCFTATGQAP